MFTYDVAVFYLGKLVDNMRVSAHDALEACNLVELVDKDYSQSCYELSAKVVFNGTYRNYYGVVINGNSNH